MRGPVQLQPCAACSQGTIVAGHASGWEADWERRCSLEHDGQRMVSVEQTRLWD
jgi:hypothetical protein